MCRGCKGESNQNARICEAQKERASDGSRRGIRVRRSRKTMGTDRTATCEVQEAAEESEGGRARNKRDALGRILQRELRLLKQAARDQKR